jgi:hypothetical protein
MFGRETRMLLRHYLEQGTSKSALARQLGVSRDTIHADQVISIAISMTSRCTMDRGRRCRRSSMRTNRSSKRASRRIPSYRRFACSTRFGLRGMPVATHS